MKMNYELGYKPVTFFGADYRTRILKKAVRTCKISISLPGAKNKKMVSLYRDVVRAENQNKGKLK